MLFERLRLPTDSKSMMKSVPISPSCSLSSLPVSLSSSYLHQSNRLFRLRPLVSSITVGIDSFFATFWIIVLLLHLASCVYAVHRVRVENFCRLSRADLIDFFNRCRMCFEVTPTALASYCSVEVTALSNCLHVSVFEAPFDILFPGGCLAY